MNLDYLVIINFVFVRSSLLDRHHQTRHSSLGSARRRETHQQSRVRAGARRFEGKSQQFDT